MSYLDDKPNLKNKWMDVYNSIVRIKFYMYLEMHNSKLLKDLDAEFSNFVQTHLNINDNNLRFFGGNTLIGFSYLILIRLFEVLRSEFTQDEMEKLLQKINWKVIGITKFNDIETKYGCKIEILAEVKPNGKDYYTSDDSKIFFFIRKLRNAISHYRYEHPTTDSIRLIDKNSKGDIEFDITMSYANFLNFCVDIGTAVHKTLMNNSSEN